MGLLFSLFSLLALFSFLVDIASYPPLLSYRLSKNFSIFALSVSFLLFILRFSFVTAARQSVTYTHVPVSLTSLPSSFKSLWIKTGLIFHFCHVVSHKRPAIKHFHSNIVNEKESNIFLPQFWFSRDPWIITKHTFRRVRPVWFPSPDLEAFRLTSLVFFFFCAS